MTTQKIDPSKIRQSRIQYIDDQTGEKHYTSLRQTFFFSHSSNTKEPCLKQQANGVTLILMPTENDPSGSEFPEPGWAPKINISNWQEL